MAARRHRPTTPETPTRRRLPISPRTPQSSARHSTPIYNPLIDPALYTPSKRMRSMYAGVSMTSSGSFLVSKDPMKSSTPIIDPVLEAPPMFLTQPDWGLLESQDEDLWKTKEQMRLENERLRESLANAQLGISARDHIIEGSHAQLTYQNLHLQRLNKALNAKEKKKEKGKDERVVFDGGGNVFTSDDFFAQMEQQKVRKDDQAAKKLARAGARELNKQARAAALAEWETIKAKHVKDLARWEKIIASEKSANVPKKDQTKKPVRPKKPQPVLVEVSAGGNDDDETTDDEDAD
ncbi:hypothetical protein C8J56DRAFT_785302 [Mycena floridula]|nr:hypothetical protein C8J56DRAFT_785302 [Mycena floridula]